VYVYIARTNIKSVMHSIHFLSLKSSTVKVVLFNSTLSDSPICHLLMIWWFSYKFSLPMQMTAVLLLTLLLTFFFSLCWHDNWWTAALS